MDLQAIQNTINDIRAQAVGIGQQINTPEAKAATTKIGNDLGLSEGNLSPTEINMGLAPALGVDTTATTTGMAGAVNGYKSSQDNFNQASTAAEAASKPPADTSSKGVWSAMQGAMGNQPTPFNSQQAYLDTLSQFGYTPETFQALQANRTKLEGYIGQINQYQKEIASLEDQKAQDLGNTELQYQGRLSSIFQGEKAIKERQWNSRIAAKSASAALTTQAFTMEQALITNDRQAMQDAMGMTKNIVDLATWDYQQKVNDYQWTMDTYKDMFTMMKDDEYREWTKGFETIKFEYQQSQDAIKNAIDLANSGSVKPIIKDITLGGDIIRQTIDPYTGKTISEENLGEVGKPDKNAQFVQYLTTITANTKTRKEIEKEAREAGLNPEDKDIKSAIDSVNKISSFRRWLGF